MDEIGKQPNGLKKEQKIGIILLSFFAVFAIGLGVLQIRNTMYSPFALKKTAPPIDESLTNDMNALRFRDTDKDGLNDFDELYVYTTSPYLEDTDSDGIFDKQEIDSGTNPICAEGKECESAGLASDALLTQSATNTSAFSAVAPETEKPMNINEALQDPKQLRQMLLDSGMNEQILNKISDKDLLKMIQEIMVSTSTMDMMKQLNNIK
ncbi:MAG: hypothetical protein WC430_03585 [Patescibacteria group bacterium]